MVEGFDIEAPDLRSLIQDVKAFDPKMATALRRELRRSGDEIIAAQKDELGVGDLHSQIAAGLRTRITAGTTRQGISIVTNGPRSGGASLAKVFERDTFRHPVFGSGDWVDQEGTPYFNKPAQAGYERMRERIETAVDDILRSIATS